MELLFRFSSWMALYIVLLSVNACFQLQKSWTEQKFWCSAARCRRIRRLILKVCFRKNIHVIYSSHSSLQKKKNRWYIWGSIMKKHRLILKGFKTPIYTMMPVHQSKWGHYCGPNRSHIIKRTRYTRWIFPCVKEMAVETNNSSDCTRSSLVLETDTDEENRYAVKEEVLVQLFHRKLFLALHVTEWVKMWNRGIGKLVLT